MEKLEGKGQVESHWYRWKDNINVHVGETGWESMQWTDLTQDKDKWQDLVNIKMNLQLHNMQRISWLTIWGAISSQEWFCSKEFDSQRNYCTHTSDIYSRDDLRREKIYKAMCMHIF